VREQYGSFEEQKTAVGKKNCSQSRTGDAKKEVQRGVVIFDSSICYQFDLFIGWRTRPRDHGRRGAPRPRHTAVACSADGQPWGRSRTCQLRHGRPE